MNSALRTALAEAGMTRTELARRVGVAVKTVDRWLAAPERAPHPDTRTRVAEVLGVSADSLWPQAVRSTLKLGADREIVATYPFRSLCPTSVWAGLLDGAKKRIVMAGYTSYFLWQDHPRIADRLKAKAAAGCEIRFLLGDPDSAMTREREELEGVPLTVGTRIRITLDQLAKMGPVPGVEARFSDSPAHLSQSVFVFDDQLLYTPHIGDGLGHESPLFHLRRLDEDGLYDRFSTHVGVLWGRGRPVPDVGGGA
ncbi:helix-turn-helix domain-containing protein [Streptomyces goshikiensis]|uniref:helix-turn-helix domain-containing protein n=1 Tax=Streptomyces goshikiensis TaxID=1942 RepID=UPI002E11FE61|nr:helix-turn-helix domain-containing protein [Streptomyces goshikiensis]